MPLDQPVFRARERRRKRLTRSGSILSDRLSSRSHQKEHLFLDLPKETQSNYSSRYKSAARRPNLSDQLLYNAQSYNYHTPGALNPYKAQVDRFEFAWTPIRPLTYFVQDHKSKCPIMTRWPTELMLGSSMRFRYDEKVRERKRWKECAQV